MGPKYKTWASPPHGYNSVGRPAMNSFHQLCFVTGCITEELPRVTDDRDGWCDCVK